MEKTNDWRAEIDENSIETLEFQDGETKTFTFLDEGNKKKVEDKENIVFQVGETNILKSFCVCAEDLNFLKEIKKLGTLNRMEVKVSRSNGQYTITKVE